MTVLLVQWVSVPAIPAPAPQQAQGSLSDCGSFPDTLLPYRRERVDVSQIRFR